MPEKPQALDLFDRSAGGMGDEDALASSPSSPSTPRSKARQSPPPVQAKAPAARPQPAKPKKPQGPTKLFVLDTMC